MGHQRERQQLSSAAPARLVPRAPSRAASAGATSIAGRLARLQRTIGNEGVQRVLARARNAQPALQRMTTEARQVASAENRAELDASTGWGLTSMQDFRARLRLIEHAPAEPDDDPTWEPQVSGVTVDYATDSRLLPNVTEVPAPPGLTTADTFAQQLDDLQSLGGSPGDAAEWYMIRAVEDHEQVHVKALRETLDAMKVAMEMRLLQGLRPVGDERAMARLSIQQQWAENVATVRALYNDATGDIGESDHAPGGATDTAEHAVVDPMIAQIEAYARAQRFRPEDSFEALMALIDRHAAEAAGPAPAT